MYANWDLNSKADTRSLQMASPLNLGLGSLEMTQANHPSEQS